MPVPNPVCASCKTVLLTSGTLQLWVSLGLVNGLLLTLMASPSTHAKRALLSWQVPSMACLLGVASLGALTLVGLIKPWVAPLPPWPELYYWATALYAGLLVCAGRALGFVLAGRFPAITKSFYILVHWPYVALYTLTLFLAPLVTAAFALAPQGLLWKSLLASALFALLQGFILQQLPQVFVSVGPKRFLPLCLVFAGLLNLACTGFVGLF